MAPRKPYVRILAVLVAVAVVVGGLYWFVSSRIADMRAAMSTHGYITSVVDRGKVAATVTSSGPLAAARRRQVTTASAGVVEAILAGEGDRVEGGQVLIRLSNDDLETSLEGARLDLELARSELYDMLNPEPDHEPTDTEIEAAYLKAEKARMDLDEKLEILAGLQVTMPFSGLLDVHVEPGDEVKPGDLLAGTYSDAIVIDVPVSETRIGGIVRLGSSVHIFIHALDKPFRGEVTAIAREGEAQPAGSGAYGVSQFNVSISLRAEDGILAGMRATTSIYDPEEIAMVPLGDGICRHADPTGITAEVKGTVVEVWAESGIWTRRGWPIMRLESPDLDYEIRQAENALARAVDELDGLLHPELRTYTDLEIERKHAAVESARLTYESRKRSVDDLEVRAPIGGQVIEVDVEVGDSVSAGQDVAVVSDSDTMRLTLEVDELDVLQLAVGQPAQITVDAAPGRLLRGQVISIAREGRVQGDVAFYDVVVEVRDPEGLLSGMRATATIVIDSREDVVRVPIEALTLEGLDTGTVNTLADGEVISVPVSVGLVGTRHAEITAGLSEGDVVVITPAMPPGIWDIRMPGMQVPTTVRGR